ncbi:Hypothetical predicted protein [Mytilus galloprovincialis]|uniref:Carboxylic ester hydrolase n=1 Tax=Mytilus galloprovincialis TaxID=29158 RepID=A0A8B6EXP1_MYTGA|nr:Hypothetical predicted protein [Mytilus galloprovincialis]
MAMYSVLNLLILKTFLCIIAVNSFLLNNPVVETDCGAVEGIGTSVNEFKGIPYAEPPVGNLRWKPPVPKSKTAQNCWTGTLKANTFGNSCYQRGMVNKSITFGSEDCLYLNVWTPNTNKNANLHVMVWIHGGFLNYLNGNWPAYSPSEELVKATNMVYVSMNYRLNAFGFMALDLLSQRSPNRTSGNYGFMDQILALQWVQRNIHNFGGNKNSVTVFGQSSGGTSIYALLASPMAKGLFNKAWMLSASPVMNKTLAEASKDNLVFLKSTRCSDINCLVQLPADDVLNAIPWDVFPYWEMADQNDLPTRDLFDGALPVIDGTVLPLAPTEAWKRGQMVDVPVIISTTAQEIDDGPAVSDIAQWTWDNYTQRVTDRLSEFPEVNISRVFELYPSGVESPEYQYTSMASDLRVTCPNMELAGHMQTSFDSPIYHYVSKARPQVPSKLFGIPHDARYAAHAWDVIAFFGAIKHYYKPTQTDNDFIQTIRREIVNFVQTGKPFSDRWQPFPNTTALMESNLGVTDFYHKEQCQYWSTTGLYAYAWVN